MSNPEQFVESLTSNYLADELKCAISVTVRPNIVVARAVGTGFVASASENLPPNWRDRPACALLDVARQLLEQLRHEIEEYERTHDWTSSTADTISMSMGGGTNLTCTASGTASDQLIYATGGLPVVSGNSPTWITNLTAALSTVVSVSSTTVPSLATPKEEEWWLP